jgi:hypothetical protein
MTLSPPLIRNGIEVNSITPAILRMQFVIHVKSTFEKWNTAIEERYKVHNRIMEMIRYLEDEGFVAPFQTWGSDTIIKLDDEMGGYSILILK